MKNPMKNPHNAKQVSLIVKSQDLKKAMDFNGKKAYRLIPKTDQQRNYSLLFLKLIANY